MPIEATLCYIIKHGKILLMKKKKGIGAGYWNGPGGRLEKESLQDCAKRETFEEVNVVPEAPRKVGELFFNYAGEEWLVHVFVADDYDGIERETGEAVPKWFPLSRIPYDEMWADDRIWMPLMLAGKKFRCHAVFDKDKNMLSSEVTEVLEV